MRDEVRITFSPWTASPGAAVGFYGAVLEAQLGFLRSAAEAALTAQLGFARAVSAAALDAQQAVVRHVLAGAFTQP